MDTKTPAEWGEIYKGKYIIYEAFTEKLKSLIKDILSEIEVVQIEARPKNVESFIGKVQREGKNYNNPIDEITDLVGIRIICYYLEDVDIIGQRINDEFNVDREKSIDKSQTLDPDKFGYLSVHYIISLADNRKDLTEWKHYCNLTAEIQIRTALQHAWAAIDHKLRYKTAQEMPRDLKRKLFRLSALLEIADDEFSKVKEVSEIIKQGYSKNVVEKNYNIEIDLLSLEAYYNSSNILENWVAKARTVGYHIISDEGLEQDAKRDSLSVINLFQIKTVKELDGILNTALAKGEEILTDVINRYISVSGFSIDQIHFTPAFLIILVLLYLNKDKITEESLLHLRFLGPNILELFHNISN